jgi:hypothetical protein
LTFLMAVIFGATVLALRAIFQQPSSPALSEGARETLNMLVRSAATTALISPLIFAVTRRLLAVGTTKREERTVAT